LASLFNARQIEEIQKEDILYEFKKMKTDNHIPNKILQTMDEDLKIDFKL
jgi:transposase-like protein